TSMEPINYEEQTQDSSIQVNSEHEAIEAQAKSAMILGIVGSALFFIPVVGLVLGIIAMKKQAGPREQIIASNFQIPGRAFIIVAKACGITAIATSIFFLIYWFIIIAACITASGMRYY
ncbi:MAG: hypothetical protein GY754_02105, partial [bacterium]|nr:hypothetical protein [bacterium]